MKRTTKKRGKAKINRVEAYSEVQVQCRMALLSTVNALSEAHTAQRLHPSRQTKHLEQVESEIREAVQRLEQAAKALSPMLAFRPYEERALTRTNLEVQWHTDAD